MMSNQYSWKAESRTVIINKFRVWTAETVHEKGKDEHDGAEETVLTTSRMRKGEGLTRMT